MKDRVNFPFLKKDLKILLDSLFTMEKLATYQLPHSFIDNIVRSLTPFWNFVYGTLEAPKSLGARSVARDTQILVKGPFPPKFEIVGSTDHFHETQPDEKESRIDLIKPDIIALLTLNKRPASIHFEDVNLNREYSDLIRDFAAHFIGLGYTGDLSFAHRSLNNRDGYDYLSTLSLYLDTKKAILSVEDRRRIVRDVEDLAKRLEGLSLKRVS